MGFWIAAVLAMAFHARAAQDRIFITVEAGASDRTNTPVSFRAPHEGAWELRSSPEGITLPIQSHQGVSWFIEPGLGRGKSRRYAMAPVAAAGSPASTSLTCRAESVGGGIDLSIGTRRVLHYVSGAGRLPVAEKAIPEVYRRGGYVHPACTPSGRIITDDYPPNHVHHHGFWSAWTKTEFEGREPDFWNMGASKGRVDAVDVGSLISGPVFAAFNAQHSFVDLLARPSRRAIDELWSVRLFRTPAAKEYFMFDLEIEQRCASESELRLPKYHYGGLGYRGPRAWDGAANALYLDSNGTTNRVAGNETRPRWYWFGGQVEGQIAGVVILSHPGSFRAPQPLRVHPTEPYLCWAPSQLGEWSIRPGTPYHARYRILLLDGAPNIQVIENLWTDFASPPRVHAN